MNNKGQSLITFVLILPLIVFFIAYLIDSLNGMMNKSRLEGIIKNNLEIVLNNNIQDEEEIKNVLKENDKNLEIDIKIDGDIIKIDINSQIKYLFGNIFHHKENNIKFRYCGNYQEKNIYNCEE